jgi:UDP-N-acetylmuramoylalanine--D-glutamate ligase
MFDLKEKHALVIGLNGRGESAARLLVRQGARVTVVEPGCDPEAQSRAQGLGEQGMTVRLGCSALPDGDFDLSILSPAVAIDHGLVLEARARGLRVIGELELGSQQAKCLALALAGTNGKTTTAGLIERMLTANHRKMLVAGPENRPVCSVADATAEVDFLVLQASAAQLEATEFFRPAVAVLLNVVPGGGIGGVSPEDYVRAVARVFRNQQAFDWAIIQMEALARVRELDLPIPGKVITFSASDSSADLHLDRGLLVSRLPNWPGPLLDMAHCQLRGPHNAEDLMAALAVGHALRLPLENMADPLKTFAPPPHCFQPVAEFNGVQFINDSKATNLDALQKALLGAHAGAVGEANIWLIAGGRDEGQDFHAAGPLLAKRVKGVFLVGEAGEKIRASWSLFTPCIVLDSLLEAVAEAARNAVSGDVVLLSPACSSLDRFRNYQQRGEMFCQAVKSIGRGASSATPNTNGFLAFV